MFYNKLDEPCRVAVVSPHPDDAELGCGGSLAKHRAMGNDVTVYVLSDGEKGGNGKIRKDETIAALSVLGIPEENIYFLHYPDTELHLYISEIGSKMSQLLYHYCPQVIYIPTRDDLHQDHVAVNTAVRAAIRGIPSIGAIYEYETGRSMETFSPNYYEVLNATYVNAKLDAISEHISQLGRNNITTGHIKTRLQFRGYQTGYTCMAEAFDAKIISRVAL